tara:strand:+ start:1212 stop:1556 length:345 start_codon:yes stop_codon:yes gene_type:complete
MKTISQNKVEVVKIYRALSKELILKGIDKIDVDTLRAALIESGYSDRNAAGEAYKSNGLRLQINKALLVIKDSGLKAKNWPSEFAYLAWKKERFVRIVAPTIIPNIGTVIDELD